ncbi:glucose-6-phosphate isomerase [Moorellaceae bacterium AZ2]
MHLFKPFNTICDLKTGVLSPPGNHIVRYLADMKEMFHDREAVETMLKENPKVYEFYNVVIPEEDGHLQHCTSIIYPGKVGKEYFMTKGHFHAVAGTAEIYVCLAGKGLLLMQTEDGQAEVLEMYPGSISYIPPYWAHRTVNTGDEPLVFFGVYRGDAGHNYGTIEKQGFSKLVFEEEGRPRVIDNPRYNSRGGD